MKSFTLLAVVVAVFAFAQAMSPEEKNAMKAQIAGECMAKEGASDDEMQRLKNHEEPTTHEGKCAIACFMETIGIIQDGKASLEGGIALAQKMHPGSEKAIEVTKTIHTDCSAISDGDRCEYALKLAKCCKESMTKMGLTYDDDM